MMRGWDWVCRLLRVCPDGEKRLALETRDEAVRVRDQSEAALHGAREVRRRIERLRFSENPIEQVVFPQRGPDGPRARP